MIVNVPTKIIPIWFIERWKKENAEPGSALDIFITQMIKDWELENIDKMVEQLSENSLCIIDKNEATEIKTCGG